eukprot:s5442_g1.t1
MYVDCLKFPYSAMDSPALPSTLLAVRHLVWHQRNAAAAAPHSLHGPLGESRPRISSGIVMVSTAISLLWLQRRARPAWRAERAGCAARPVSAAELRTGRL